MKQGYVDAIEEKKAAGDFSEPETAKRKFLNVRDLINVGIFSALYLVIFMCITMLGIIPIISILVPAISGLILGIVYMLLIAKVQKFGKVTLLGLICGAVFFAMGYGIAFALIMTLLGLAADFILLAGKKSSATRDIISYTIFNFWTMATILPLWLASEKFIAGIREGYGDEYADSLAKYAGLKVFILFLLITMIGGLVGGLIGRFTLKKHFIKAGIA